VTVTSKVGDGATVSRDDIERKLREIRGEAGDVAESGRNYAVIAAVATAVAVVALSYLFGRRKGNKRSTVVEIRRV
jgi:phage-related protein